MSADPFLVFLANPEARRAMVVEHFVGLYMHPGFGPAYARQAVLQFLQTPGNSLKGIGHDVKARVDVLDPDGLIDAAERASCKKAPRTYAEWL